MTSRSSCTTCGSPAGTGSRSKSAFRDRDFLYDVSFDVSDAALSDRIEDAVDYRDVAQCIREISDGRSYHLIEALAAAVADAIVARFPVERVRVRVRKPNLELAGLQLGEAVAVVERASGR